MLKKCPKCGHSPLVLKRLVVRKRELPGYRSRELSHDILDVQVCPECGFRQLVKDRKGH